jgi:hypothetical protein
MSTLELTWQSDVNRAIADFSTALLYSKSMIWYWKSALCDVGLSPSPWTAKTGVWSVYSSCDGSGGTNFGNGNSVDWWSTGGSYTFANVQSKLVWAAAASNHSWIVMKSPNMADGYPFYVILDLNHATPANYTLVYCKTAPTGGTATARPTSTDECAYTAAYNHGGILNNGTGAASKVHFSLSDNGEWVWLMSKDTSATFHFGAFFRQVVETKSYDDFKAICGSDYVGAKGHIFLISSQTNTSVSLFQQYGTGVSTGGISARPLASAAVSTNVVAWLAYLNANNLGLPNAQSVGSVASATASPVTGFFESWPMYVTSTTAGYGLKGRIKDFYIHSLAYNSSLLCSTYPNGTAEPAPGPPKFISVGNIWIPMNVVPSL